jgi:hypothetical protein
MRPNKMREGDVLCPSSGKTLLTIKYSIELEVEAFIKILK